MNNDDDDYDTDDKHDDDNYVDEDYDYGCDGKDNVDNDDGDNGDNVYYNVDGENFDDYISLMQT